MIICPGCNGEMEVRDCGDDATLIKCGTCIDMYGWFFGDTLEEVKDHINKYWEPVTWHNTRGEETDGYKIYS